ncbi:MAG TPA: AMP-binding protein [Mycobacteriales bacterium]|nr:AMP-binding protein [Mycobacteriales bacterium]
MSSEQLADLVRDAALRAPDRTALIHRTQSLSWGELAGQVERVAGALIALGLQPGDRIGLQLGNTLDFPPAFFGALRAGLTVVPINPAFTEPELATVLEDSAARVLVTASVAAERLGVTELIVAGRQIPDGAHGLADLIATGTPGEARHTDVAALVYTSGTSGRPRGAMLTHRALLGNLDQCGRLDPPVLQANDVLLLALPLFHVYGLGPGLGMLARAGATGVLVDRFDPVETLAVMAEHRVTSVLGAPAMYRAWTTAAVEPGAVATGFGTVRLAMSGAAPLPAAVAERLRAITTVPIQQGYGLTETGPVLTCTVGFPDKPGSIGRPIPGVELWLRDEDGEPVEEGDPGEVVVRGRNLFSGYWPDGLDGPDDAGWFATGDVAYLDPDGDLHLVDRRKELIIVSGFNVYPAEVEAVLLAHPAVTEAAVVGIPDEHRGEAIRAFVVLTGSGGGTGAAELASWCARSLARFKCPTEFEIVGELPHSATGKVRKARLRSDS